MGHDTIDNVADAGTANGAAMINIIARAVKSFVRFTGICLYLFFLLHLQFRDFRRKAVTIPYLPP